MATNKLTNEQRATLLEWLAADYDSRLIMGWFSDNGWPTISRNTLKHYRKHYALDIDKVRATRYAAAISDGLAVKAERIKRLKKHADELEAIKWIPDDKGRLWNEKSWRETLDQIADEVGDKKQKVEHSGEVIVKGYTSVTPDQWDEDNSDV